MARPTADEVQAHYRPDVEALNTQDLLRMVRGDFEPGTPAYIARPLQDLAITIAQDQQRVRENMKALRGSAEEKQLLQRYTHQLGEQETRLDALKQEVTTTSQLLDKARGELGALVGSVSFELNVTPQTTR